MNVKYFLYIVIILFFCTGCVESESFMSLENRVAALEMETARKMTRQTKAAVQNEQNLLKVKADLENIETRLNTSHSISQEEYAEMKYTIQTLRSDFQKLQGQIEEMNHGVSEYSPKDSELIENQFDRFDQAISKNDGRLTQLEKYMGFEPSIPGEMEKKSASDEASGNNSEQKLYAFAKKLFDDGDKENARIQFENFINKYPQSDNADNARFWIADSYYFEKWFEKAILEYQKVLELYPNSNKLAAARLKQGYAFAELGEKANARLILKELIKKHPNSNEAKFAQKKLKTLN
ncbi:tol-pal system protein YbgF [Desulfobacula sp.]|uniref:tol-pal system protein YbgF n=1 Tax=Desulfobacula sp. TaxID=2593537 RepID=UPI002602041E|nr:tol-pal system protein YbgF [Desulfobacula sp.]